MNRYVETVDNIRVQLVQIMGTFSKTSASSTRTSCISYIELHLELRNINIASYQMDAPFSHVI